MNAERKSLSRNPWLLLICAILWLFTCAGYIFDALKMHNYSASRLLTIVATALCAAAFGWLWSKTRNPK